MTLYPLVFEPLLRPKPWGGCRLADYGKPVGTEPIGESWEVADLPEGRSVVANGPLAGRTLHELVAERGPDLLGAAHPTAGGGFPLLVKLLDARDNLSIQVHPTPAYVARHAGAHLKTEAWVVLEAEPDAQLLIGVAPGVDRDAFARHVADGTVPRDLIAWPARPGDCHFLPSGVCHALGAGVLVAEVQTPSDTTFRVFDWGRTSRELHLEQALECIDFEGGHRGPVVAPALSRGGLRTSPLLDTDHFSLERIDADAPARLEIVTNDVPVVLLWTRGTGVVANDDEAVEAATGTTVLVPARVRATARIGAGASLLRMAPPTAIRRLLA